MHAVAVRALEVLMKKEEPLVIAFQNVAEFWNVVTRPQSIRVWASQSKKRRLN